MVHFYFSSFVVKWRILTVDNRWTCISRKTYCRICVENSLQKGLKMKSSVRIMARQVSCRLDKAKGKRYMYSAEREAGGGGNFAQCAGMFAAV